MIVVSVLLILVAVTLLFLGLAGGSSTLLIGSIVASLLAAVALVIGARQAAAMRRAVVDPVTPGVPPIDLDAGTPAAEPVGARSGFAAATTASAMAASAAAAASERRGGRRREPEPSFADGPSATDEGLSSPPETHPRVANRDDAESALAADAAYREADPSYGADDPAYAPGPGSDFGPGPDRGPDSDFGSGSDRGPGSEFGSGSDRGPGSEFGSGSDRGPGSEFGPGSDRGSRSDLGSGVGDRGFAGAEPVYDDAAAFDEFRATHGAAAPGPGADPGHDQDPDYGRASTYIGGARSANPGENSWRRAHADDRLDQDAGPRDDDGLGDPLRPDGPQRTTGGARMVGEDPPPPGTSPSVAGAGPSDPPGFAPASGFSEGSGFSEDSGFSDVSGRSGGPGYPGGPGFADGSGFSGGSGAAGEFGEPDEDDPADEPPPQAVRPADAVQVARLNDEVMVVDGRPRYHMADCPHLVDRQTEALPVSEAVELGFSPCGQCRPVDRLVARATRH